jgi:flagellar capping protein FliD
MENQENEVVKEEVVKTPVQIFRERIEKLHEEKNTYLESLETQMKTLETRKEQLLENYTKEVDLLTEVVTILESSK